MAPSTYAARYEVCRDEILDLVEARGLFAEAEGLIEASELPEEQCAALWLLAWGLWERGSRVGLPHPPPGQLITHLPIDMQADWRRP